MAAALVKYLADGIIYLVNPKLALKLANKGWSRTTRAAPDAKTLTESQLKNIPDNPKSKSFDLETEVISDLAKGAGKGVGRHRTRAALDPASAEKRPGQETSSAQARRARAAKKKAADAAAKQRKDATEGSARAAADFKKWSKNKESARKTAIDSAGKDRKGWWSGRSKREKDAIKYATGFGLGVGGTLAFKQWFKIEEDKPVVSAAQTTKPSTVVAKKVIPKPKRKPTRQERFTSRADPDKGMAGAGRRIKTTKKTKKKVKETQRELKFWEGGVRYINLPEWLGGGRIKVDSSPDVFKEYETSGDKHGGQIKRSMKKPETKPRKAKAKTRKRASLRGGRAELRGG